MEVDCAKCNKKLKNMYLHFLLLRTAIIAA